MNKEAISCYGLCIPMHNQDFFHIDEGLALRCRFHISHESDGIEVHGCQNPNLFPDGVCPVIEADQEY